MLTVSEAARILNVSQTRVRQLVNQGVLQAEKAGRSWLLDETSVMSRLSSKPQVGRPSAKGPVNSTALENSGLSAEKEEALHNLYVEGKRLLSEATPNAVFLYALDNQEEASFLMAVSDFFLQQRQMKLVAQGVF